jgi:hypothetical protein
MTKERGGSEYPEASAENTAPGALDGIRVLELSTVVMGPYAAQVLGDLGADVIKVETGKGDMNRFMGGGPPGMSGISLTVNRNKRSVRLDLKKPEGREAFLRILDTCDVFVTNVRPGALKRLGLDYETVGPSRPRLVYLRHDHDEGAPGHRPVPVCPPRDHLRRVPDEHPPPRPDARREHRGGPG